MYNRHKLTEGQRIGEMKYWISYKHNKNGQIRSLPHNLSRTASFLHTAHAQKVYRAMTPWYDKFNDDDIIEHRFMFIVSLLNRHASASVSLQHAFAQYCAMASSPLHYRALVIALS